MKAMFSIVLSPSADATAYVMYPDSATTARDRRMYTSEQYPRPSSEMPTVTKLVKAKNTKYCHREATSSRTPSSGMSLAWILSRLLVLSCHAHPSRYVCSWDWKSRIAKPYDKID
jgi:hypothetical protein